ncbi:PREDICTED: uncharacterized protein ZNF561-AS1-like [Rhinopithecus bieti]|uniref:uncharacterized protein ZNF561-AS1-like n=1 Tax=Rhinopithecus bieti TaxID=61621 RepID=UPI00083BBF52|nr:PREDICTED: uncharacterized protein ZNF561-AS1-like [Rhinopithecus bieti]
MKLFSFSINLAGSSCPQQHQKPQQKSSRRGSTCTGGSLNVRSWMAGSSKASSLCPAVGGASGADKRCCLCKHSATVAQDVCHCPLAPQAAHDLLAQALPLEFPVHQHQPGDYVLIKG